MAKIFITLTGTKHYFGNDFLEKGMKIRLEKEPDNEYDKEAIKVTYEGLGKIGYVANSSYTVIGESMSAGRLYDKIGDTAYFYLISLWRILHLRVILIIKNRLRYMILDITLKENYKIK